MWRITLGTACTDVSLQTKGRATTVCCTIFLYQCWIVQFAVERSAFHFLAGRSCFVLNRRIKAAYDRAQHPAIFYVQIVRHCTALSHPASSKRIDGEETAATFLVAGAVYAQNICQARRERADFILIKEKLRIRNAFHLCICCR